MGLNCLDDDLDLVSHAQVKLIMLSYPRQAPPSRPSRSLEGLEKVIPPGADYPGSRTDLQLNKPLPANPLDFEIRDVSAWSDDTSFASSDDCAESEDSTESYPIFVSSGSDDYDEHDEFVDHPPAATEPLPPVESTSPQPHDYDYHDPPDASSSLALNAFLSEERYGPNSSWAQSRIGTNHYFREKKWDFFPELGPSGLQNSNLSHGRLNSTRRKKDAGRLNLPVFNRNRWHPERASAGPGFAIASNVRDSIRSYVHRTLSKAEKPNQHDRPVTAPSLSCKTSMSLSERALANSGSRQASLAMSDQSRSLLLSNTDCSTDERHSDDRSAHCPKQLAVPISSYQKYGASIWDKSGGTKRASHVHHRQGAHVRFPKHHTPKRSKHVADRYSTSAPTLSSSVRPGLQQQHSKDHAKALHGSTSQVRGTFDDAKRKVTEFKENRRRERLKAQIKLVGPLNPYSSGNGNASQ